MRGASASKVFIVGPSYSALVAPPRRAHIEGVTIRTLLSVFLLLLASMPMAAAAQPAVLPGQPLEYVTVVIESIEDGKAVGRGITGNDGIARIYDIPGGSYRIVARGLAKSIEKLAASTARLAPPAPEAALSAGGAARTSLAMPARPSAVVIRIVAPGTTREARKPDTALVDGIEMIAFSVPVSGPITVSLRHEDQ